jgi:hypothetical protein
MPGRFRNQEEVRSLFPICFQSRPVRWHQLRNNSMLLAYDRAVSSEPSLPSRTCCRNASATGTKGQILVEDRPPDGSSSLGDLGWEGEAGIVTVAFKKSKRDHLTIVQQQFSKAHNGIRAIGERANEDDFPSLTQRQ